MDIQIYNYFKLLFNHKIGLVLSGGGARGSYQIGVFQALQELGIFNLVEMISGTSIGAINGLLFLTGENRVWQETWKDATFENFLKIEDLKFPSLKSSGDLSGFLKTSIGNLHKDWEESSGIEEFILKQDLNFLSRDGLNQVLEKYIPAGLMKESDVEFYACAYNINLNKPEYFSLNDLEREEFLRIIRASASIPLLYKPVKIGEYKYMDGGINFPLYGQKNTDNVPVKPVWESNCDILIVVYLNHDETVDYSSLSADESNRIILEIVPSQRLEEISGTGSFDFSRSSLEERIELGYHDAMYVIAPMMVKMLQGKNIEDLLKHHNDYNDALRNKFSQKS